MSEKSIKAKQNRLLYLFKKWFTFFFLLSFVPYPRSDTSQPIAFTLGPAGHTSLGTNWLVPAGVHWAAHKSWAVWS